MSNATKSAALRSSLVALVGARQLREAAAPSAPETVAHANVNEVFDLVAARDGFGAALDWLDAYNAAARAA